MFGQTSNYMTYLNDSLKCILFFLFVGIWDVNGKHDIWGGENYEIKTKELFLISVQYAYHNKKFTTANFSRGIWSIGNGKKNRIISHILIVGFELTLPAYNIGIIPINEYI